MARLTELLLALLFHLADPLGLPFFPQHGKSTTDS